LSLGTTPGASSEAAIRGLLELRTKQKIDYRAIGRDGSRRSVRLDDDLYDQMRQAATEDNVNINEFFIHALRLYVGDN
jgi:predicted DNA-binding ribbon-helix-helix protein